jgi:hypothetical protein
MWNELVNQYRSYDIVLSTSDYGGGCPMTGSVAVCGIDVVGTTNNFIGSGSITLTLAPASAYGWKVTNLQLPPT